MPPTLGADIIIDFALSLAYITLAHLLGTHYLTIYENTSISLSVSRSKFKSRLFADYQRIERLEVSER